MVSAASAVLLLTLAWTPPAIPERNLASVQRLHNELAKQRASTDEGTRAAASFEVALLTEAVGGDGRAGVASRDAAAYQLLGLGYSAKETADIVSGRVSKQALDTAHAMQLAGRGREAAADYVDRQYHRLGLSFAASTDLDLAIPGNPTGQKPSSVRTALKPAASPGPAFAATKGAIAALEPIEAAIVKYARLHAVDPALIRAIIGAESRFAAGARSPAGAVGLMQLMPATARALGVDPRIADQNIEGGVRYLSGLLQMFGGVELALVAYNAGPGLAQRYARGQASLYGETRNYVRDVLARMRMPRAR